MTKLLTQQDLAERWQVDVSTITNWRKEGLITPAKGIPAIRFTEQHILRTRRCGKLEKVSPLMYRKLEKEKEQLEEENRRLKGIITNILVEGIANIKGGLTMNDLQIYLLALEKVILNFWPVLIITTAMLIRLWRWERLEKKRMEKAIKRDKLKRVHY